MTALFEACCGCFGSSGRGGGRQYFPPRNTDTGDFDADDAAVFSTVGRGGRNNASFGESSFSVSAWASSALGRIFGGGERSREGAGYGYGGLGGAPATGEDLLFNDDDEDDEPELLTRQHINTRLQQAVRTGGGAPKGDTSFLDSVQRAIPEQQVPQRSRDFAVSPFARLAGPTPPGFSSGGFRAAADDDFG